MSESTLSIVKAEERHRNGHSGKNYHNIMACQKTLGIDNLIVRYKKDKQYLVDLIFGTDNNWISTIWTAEGPLPMDNQCNWAMGEASRTFYICSQCKNIKRLIPCNSLPCKEEKGTKKNICDTPILILSGDYLGKYFIIVTQKQNELIEMPNYYLILEKIYLSFPPTSCAINSANKEKNVSRMVWGDTFTMNILISWGMEHLFMQKNLPHIYASMSSFICNKKGYQIYEKASFSFQEMIKTPAYMQKKKNIIKKNILVSFLIQLLIIYNEFSHFYCIHGFPSVSSLYFFDTPCTYEYEVFRGSYIIDNPFTLKMGDWSMATAIFGDKLYTCTPEFWLYNKSTWTQYVSLGNMEGHACFKLTKNTGHKNYIHPYSSAFDFYSILIELMREKTFYNSIYYYNDTKIWWESIWLNKNKSFIEEYLENHSNKVDDLRGIWLKCISFDILLQTLFG